MLLSEKLGEAVLLLSLVALCTGGRSRILDSLVNSADNAQPDPSSERDDHDDFLLKNNAKSSTTAEGSAKSSGQRSTYIYSHYHMPYHAHYPYAYGSFAGPYHNGHYAMTTPYRYHSMAGYHPYSAMNSLYGFHHMAAPYFSPAMPSPYGYSPMAGYYPYSAMNPLYGYHHMSAPYFNSAMLSPYGYSPMAGYHPYSAMNPLYGFNPMAAFSFHPGMYSFYPMATPHPFPAMNPPYVPLNGSSPQPTMTAYTFHAPMSHSTYLRPNMGYLPHYPPVGSSYYPMNSFYPNSFHPPMYPVSYLHPPMSYPFVYPAMNTMYPYNLMNPMYNPAHLMHPMNLYSPMNPMANPAHPMHPMNLYSPMNPMTNPAHPMHPMNLYSPMNAMTNPAHPMHPMNLYSPMNAMTNPAHPMNLYNPMNHINGLYNPMNFQYPFHPPMQVASYFLNPPLGTSYLLPSSGYGHLHPVPTQAASHLLQPSMLNLHMHFPYSYQAGMYSPYFMPPYHPSAALQGMYPPYGFAAGVPGAMAWNPFGGAAWNPYFAMGYGSYPQWPSQFAHMWPLHPYYQAVVPAQEGMCSFDRPFKCWGSSTCIPIDSICDKSFDCINHADEDPRVCIAGRRPAFGTLASYLALPNQQWMLQKLFNSVDPYTTAYALKLATSLGDLRWSLALTDENINNTKTVLHAVKNGDEEPLLALGMEPSAWESVKFLMSCLLNTDFFLD